jgi:hypothetical protein
VRLICLGCGQRVHVRHLHLCPECLSQLPQETRERLERKDVAAQGRLFQLLSAIHRGVPLTKIQVAA